MTISKELLDELLSGVEQPGLVTVLFRPNALILSGFTRQPLAVEDNQWTEVTTCHQQLCVAKELDGADSHCLKCRS